MESDWPETDAELKSLRKRVAELEELRQGDFELTRALAEDAGIEITASDKLPGRQWEQFHDGVMKLAADKARMDFLFSDQTDVIIVDHGVIGPEPALVLSREHLDRLIEREKPNEGQG